MVYTGGDWTDERVELLKKLWQDGLSASQIMKQLGGCTRSAVIGKVHRLGLSGRSKPSTPQRIVYKAPRPAKPAPQPKPDRPMALSGHPWQARQIAGEAKPPAPPPVRYVEEAAGTATILTLGAHQCKWPIGDPQDAGFTICGRRRGAGPYCDEHQAVAVQPASKKKTSGAELARSLRRYI